MSLRNRYSFIKKVYPNTLLIFIKNNKYFCIDNDYYIYKYFNNDIKQLRLNNIDYIIIDNLNIIEKSFNKNNYYNKYYKLILIKRFMKVNLYKSLIKK